MKSHFLIGIAGALALASCGGSETADEAAGAQAPATAAPTAEAAATDPSTPQGFVEAAASSDMYEIEAGRLAGEKARSLAVKEFGAMLVSDHTASSAKLKTAAAEAGDVPVPAEMSAKHRGWITQLERASTTSFDQVFAQQQVTAHQEALTLLQTQAESGTAAPLKAFATETVPVIEAHLRQAQELGTAVEAGAEG